MSEFKILHLSDIHIGNTYKTSNDIAYKIISDIDNNGFSKLKSVVITGDVFDGRAIFNDKLVKEAVDFFETILNEINLNQEDEQIGKEDFIFIPGNHDLMRVDDPIKQWEKYRTFLQIFYDEIPEYYNLNDYSVFKKYDEAKIVFIGFNSCQIERKKIFDKSLINKINNNLSNDKLQSQGINKDTLLKILETESDDEYDDFGYIPISQITAMERRVKKVNEYNVVALFHHHFYLFPEVAQAFGDSSVIRNHTQVINHLRYMNVSTVLHGHKHFDLERPFITDEYYTTTESIINTFSAGSVGLKGQEKHTFSIIDFYEKKDDIKLVHSKFIYNGEMLEPISRKQIPPKSSANKIVKLLEFLEASEPNVSSKYIKMNEKLYKVYKMCNDIINWVSEVITGFEDVYKYLEKDYKNILFLIYAINYRTLSYKNMVDQELSYFESSSKLLKEFYNTELLSSDIQFKSEEYHELFEEKKLNKVTNKCDALLKDTNIKNQFYLSFSMLGIFFSDLYLVLTEYADDFKESIKYKVNIKIEENKFHENVPAPRIVLRSDADRRSAYLEIVCNEATAHKMAVLFVKEFDLLVNKFEDYFKLIGLKLYYLLPKIDKDKMKDTIDNYNFEAYIPTLLPLLTGDNIYPSKVVFARELIQNSIDAISVRKETDKKDFSEKIFINIGKDLDNKRYFIIRDYGTGMDRYKIERYFTSIGRSFYSGEEYAELKINYKPISNFGIGFLSSFMVCREIDVKTKYFLEDSESLKLHIPNYDGCFFIERNDGIEIGTEIKLNLENDLEDQQIISYIKDTMVDINYPIAITSDSSKTEIPSYSIRESTRNNLLKFFIPFTDDYRILDIDYEKDVISGDFISKYQHGLLIYSLEKENKIRKNSYRSTRNYSILNSGILINNTNLMSLFNINDRLLRDNYLNHMIFNFPTNWIQLDVSREKSGGLSENIKNLPKAVESKIADCLKNQIKSFLDYSKKEKVDLPVGYLQEVINYSMIFCGSRNSRNNIYKQLKSLSYVLKVQITTEGVSLRLIHDSEVKAKEVIFFKDDLAYKEFEKWRIKFYNKDATFGDFLPVSSKAKLVESSDFNRIHYEEFTMSNMYLEIDELLKSFKSHKIIRNLEIDNFNKKNKPNVLLVLLVFFFHNIRSDNSFKITGYNEASYYFIEKNVLETLKISNLEDEVFIKYSDFQVLVN